MHFYTGKLVPNSKARSTVAKAVHHSPLYLANKFFVKKKMITAVRVTFSPAGTTLSGSEHGTMLRATLSRAMQPLQAAELGSKPRTPSPPQDCRTSPPSPLRKRSLPRPSYSIAERQGTEGTSGDHPVCHPYRKEVSPRVPVSAPCPVTGQGLVPPPDPL